MLPWLRPQSILALVSFFCYLSQLVSSKTYDKFYCSTEEGQHQLSCPDESALLTDVSILKVYRRTQMCAPDVHNDYLARCQGSIDASSCEGNKTCSIEVSTRNYVECEGKSYPPTYFFVKYTCTQIYTMCTDTEPLRNTLYGFIVSPGYPHPMADNLKCSISIEADPSMYIELVPIQLRLVDAMKCRSEYLEIFGYLNSFASNSSEDETRSDRTNKQEWKSCHVWCGTDRSTNQPASNSRYLIKSNSVYISLQSATSKKHRSFKLRYKVVPAISRVQYDLDGVAYDGSAGLPPASGITGSTTNKIFPTTIAVPTIHDSDQKSFNPTQQKSPIRKEILIGIVSGVVVLVLAILAGVGIFLLKRRRPSSPSVSTTKKTTPTGPSSNNNNNNNNSASKPTTKVADKAPLLERGDSGTNNAAAKRKLVPERTVQIADVNTSRFKPGSTADGIGKAPTNGKELTSSSSDAATVAPASNPTISAKQPLTAADSGIYGADLNDDLPPVTKPVTTNNDASEKIYGLDLPDKSETKSVSPSISVVVNPITEQNPTSNIEENNIQSNIVTENHVSTTPLDESTPENPESSFNIDHFDDTVKSAYTHLIDATISENEGNIASGSVNSSAQASRRTSYARQPLLSHETYKNESIPRKPPQFNPLHVILKKDSNKYYTTEYI